MADPVNALRRGMEDRTPGYYTADTAPADLAPIYNMLAPAPNTEYASILPLARDTKTGVGRWAMPNVLREGLGGWADLLAGVKTGKVTPRAAETLAFSGIGMGHVFAPEGAIASGGGKIKAPSGVIRTEDDLIRAYHGSPHNFDKFDASKIGTGEGAQAYGYGHYFAEKEGVARSYRDALSGAGIRIPGASAGRSGYTVAGMEVPTGMAGHKALDTINDIDGLMKLRQQGGSPDFEKYLVQQIDGRIARWRAENDASIKAGYSVGGAGFDDMDALAKFWESAGRGATKEQIINKPPGHMYEVGIRADPARFLDWDKPLSAQGQPVQEALSKFGYRADKPGLAAHDDALLAALQGTGSTSLPKLPPDPLGANIYESPKIVPGMYRDKVGAATALSEAGIPGIRYLDQGSRSAGQGSSNYVVFPGNEELIQILRKYGVAAPVPVAVPLAPPNAGQPTETQRDIMNPRVM